MRFTTAFIALALSAALGLTGCSERPGYDAVPPPPVEDAATREGGCGGAGSPDCPLQSWMKANASTALASGDFDRIARATRRIGTFAPPDWGTWKGIAVAAERAATARDLEGVRLACKSCHDAYRDRYRKERRARALP